MQRLNLAKYLFGCFVFFLTILSRFLICSFLFVCISHSNQTPALCLSPLSHSHSFTHLQRPIHRGNPPPRYQLPQTMTTTRFHAPYPISQTRPLSLVPAQVPTCRGWKRKEFAFQMPKAQTELTLFFKVTKKGTAKMRGKASGLADKRERDETRRGSESEDGCAM